MSHNQQMRATGIGSVPGTEFAGWARFVMDGFGADGIVFVPELPDRGTASMMVGRTLGLLPLPFDLQPAGWRLAPGAGVDQRRARSQLGEDLDRLEEVGDGLEFALKQQVTGPLTLVATVERTRGDKLLADHGARREVAEALAEGLREHVRDLRRRTGVADLIVQVDEPAMTAVLAGQVPTASGFGRHRVVQPQEADALLRLVVDAIVEAGATPVLHSCASDVPVELVAGAGFQAVAFDLRAVGEAGDAWAEAFEGGLDLWFGDTEPRSIEVFMSRLGFAVESWAGRCVVTPPCGLVGTTPAEARRTLEAAVTTAVAFG